MFGKVYEDDIKKYQSIKYPKSYYQNLSYYLYKDNNVKEMIKLMKKYSKYSEEQLFSEEFRINIIITNFNNIEELCKVIGIFEDSMISKDGFLNQDIDKIFTCCRVFPDHIGKHIIQLTAINTMFKVFIKIIKLYKNGKSTEENKKEILFLLKGTKGYFKKIHNNEEKELELVRVLIESQREIKKATDETFSKEIKKVIERLTSIK